MKHSYKLLIITLILVGPLATLSATVQTWLGLGFIGHTYTVAADEQQYFKSYEEYIKNNNPSLDSVKIDKINMIGPSFDFSFYPYYEIPIGIKISDNIVFPTGVNGEMQFRSYHGDLNNRLKIGISYAQSYSDKFGLFADFGFEYDFIRIETNNIKNNKSELSYVTFDNYGLYGEIGFLTTIETGYFKFGCGYNRSLKNESSGIDFIFSGGFRI